MGRSRAVNPAKLRRDVTALEQQPPQELFQRRLDLRRVLSYVLLNLLTVALFTVCFAPFDCGYLAYVALVPWALALDGTPSRRWALLLAWFAGLLVWAVNLYWLTWVTLVGYAALVLYLAAHWLVAAAILRAGMRRNWPMWLVLPCVWTALEYARAYLLSGFPWLYLAHSQYARTQLIQVADLTGPYGVSLFVAMVNGLVIDVLISPLFMRSRGAPQLSRRLIGGLAATVLVTAAMLGYGAMRLREVATREGPVIGIVQQAFPISLRGRSESSDVIFQAHVGATTAFLGAGCDLVIWPETMLPGPGANPELLQVDLERMGRDELRALAEKFIPADRLDEFRDAKLREYLSICIRQGAVLDDGAEVLSMKRCAEVMAGLSSRLGCPILAGGQTLHRNTGTVLGPHDLWVRRNSAMWFANDGRAREPYSKMHLVPFSEYVPFKDSWPGLYGVLRRFVPDVMPQLDPGRRVERFPLIRDGRQWALAAPICYEGTFARICRKMVMDRGRKAVDILVNLSNDGWFVCRWGDDGRYHGSIEQPQHLAQYCFRAVENRVPVVRAVNTGISASIDSAGRIVARVSRDGKDVMVAGTLLLDGKPGSETEFAVGHGPRVRVDSRVSPYSRVGDVFAMAVSAAAVGIAAVLIVRSRRKAKGAGRNAAKSR